MTDQIRADISARYGIPLHLVAPVQIIPRGVSGLPLPWEEGPSWKEQRSQMFRNSERVRRVIGVANPEVTARRERVRALHGEGKTTLEIADALDVSSNIVCSDLGHMGLRANRAPRSISTAALSRVDITRRMVAEGKTAAEIAPVIGIHKSSLYEMARRHGISLPRKAPAPKSQKQKLPKGVSQEAATAARKAKFLELVGKGATRPALCAALGVTANGLQRWCNRHKLTMPPSGRDERVAAQIEVVRRMHGEGRSQAAICEVLGISRSRMASLRRAAGVVFVWGQK